MKNLSTGEKTFLLYSVINVIIIWCATESIGILNDDTALGIFISWITYMISYIVIKGVSPVETS